MIVVVVAILAFCVLVYKLGKPDFAFILLFALMPFEVVLKDFIPSNLMYLVLGGYFLFSYVVSLFNPYSVTSFKFNSTIYVLLIYVIVILVINIGNWIDSDGRNWLLTYIQLFLFAFLTYNTLNNVEQIKSAMFAFLISSLLSIGFYILVNRNLGLNEIEIDGANYLSRNYSIAILFSFFFLKKAHKWSLSIIYGIVILILLLGVLLTNSRTMLIVDVVLLVILSIQDRKRIWRMALFLLFLSIGLYALIPEELIASNVDSIFITSSEIKSERLQLNTIDGNIRLLLWEASIEIVNDYGVMTGAGFGKFKELILVYRPILSNPVSNPHNSFFSVLVESGLIGLILFIVLNYMTFRNFFHNVYSIKLNIRLIWFLAFILILLGSLTKHDHYSKLFFLMIGISGFFKEHPEKDLIKK